MGSTLILLVRLSVVITTMTKRDGDGDGDGVGMSEHTFTLAQLWRKQKKIFITYKTDFRSPDVMGRASRCAGRNPHSGEHRICLT